MSQKADYLQNLNFVSQKIAILGYLTLIFTVHDFFLSKFYYFFIFLIYIGNFFVLYSHGWKNCLNNERRISKKCHKKADYLQNLNFVSQKIAILGYLTLIFTVHDFFLLKFYYFFIFLKYIGNFFVLYSHGWKNV